MNVRGSSLYAHISSKSELLWSIVNEAADDFLGAAESVDPDLPPAERLRELARAHMRVMSRELPRSTVFFHEWAHLPDDLKVRVIERRDAYQRHFTVAIERGVADGSLRVPDVELATLFVLSALNWTYHWLDPSGRLELETLAERYADMVLGALGHRRPPDAGAAAPGEAPVEAP